MKAEERRPLAAALILGVSAADCVLLAATPYSISPHGAAPLLAGCAVLALLAWIYRRWRPEPVLAGLATTALAFAAGTAATGILSYLLAGLASARPLFDAPLAAADQLLGLDWLAYRKLLFATPALRQITTACYALLGIELIALILTLDLIRQPQRARELLLGFMLTALCAIFIGAIFPAAGAYVHYASPEISGEPYVVQYLALRDGSLHQIDLLQMQGIVQFPSFHAALAVVCSVAVRGTRLFWPLLPLNLLVVAATPPAGGHHFVDVIAGLLIAAAVMSALCRTGRSAT